MKTIQLEYMVRLVISSLFVGLFSLNSAAQENKNLPPLERTLTVTLKANSAKEALKIIEVKGEFSFAYKTDILDSSQVLSRSYQNQTTREILDDLFQGKITYKGKGNYIVLKKSAVLKSQEINLEGYILDLNSGEKIPFATVYDTVSFTSTVSDEYGHYVLKMSNPTNIYLNVKKTGYCDTAVRITKTGTEILTIQLRPEPKKLTIVSNVDSTDFLSKLRNMKFLRISEERKANILNFKDQLKTKMQFSVIPNIGTNGLLSSSTVVDYSFNLFGGITGGVRKAEIGAFVNIDVDSVKHFQAAGFLNAVGGYQEGVQFAGFGNFNNANFKGGQFAGFTNIVRKDFYGIQAAGFSNVTAGKFYGIQASGFSNVTRRKFEGIQVSGFSNVLIDSAIVIQATGFSNVAGNYTNGVQASGFSNVAGTNFTGIQAAGFMNYARKDFTGVQVSGFLNVASNVKGAQVSFININDTITGVPIGFFSFSKKGLHQLEISTNEFLPVQLAFKTGTNQFYNSFIGAMRTKKNARPVFAFGYGIGTSLGLSPKSRIFFDVQSLSLQKGGFSDGNYLGKFIVSYQYQVKKKFAISVGPSFNILTVRNASTLDGNDLLGITPYSIYTSTFGADNKFQTWIGGHVAIRLF